MFTIGADELGRFLDQDDPARVPRFEAARDLTPVVLADWAAPVDQLMAVVDRVAAAGFTAVDGGRPATRHDLLALADLLTLGDPLVPPHSGPLDLPYGGAIPSPRLDAARTAVSLCLSSPGPSAVRLFNATAAFVEVARRDPAAAAALLAPAGPAEPPPGPPFAIVDGHLLTRCPPADAVRWATTCADPEAARRGLALLGTLAAPGPYALEVPLRAGQGIVLSAARIWPGDPLPAGDADLAGAAGDADLAGDDRGGGPVVLHGLFATDLVIAGR